MRSQHEQSEIRSLVFMMQLYGFCISVSHVSKEATDELHAVNLPSIKHPTVTLTEQIEANPSKPHRAAVINRSVWSF